MVGAAGLALGLGGGAAAAPRPLAKDPRLWAAAQTARPEQLKLHPRLYMLAKLIEDLGRNPPARMGGAR